MAVNALLVSEWMTYLTGLVVGSAESKLAAKLDNLIFKIMFQGPPCAVCCAYI